MILILDNYDSFTYNLIQALGSFNISLLIKRSDEISIQDIILLDPTHIILSPGSGHPKSFPSTIKLIQQYGHKFPILGICLGHQMIGLAFNNKIDILSEPKHSHQSQILHRKNTLFQDIPLPFLVTRYHSLIIKRSQLSKSLTLTAWTSQGDIMGIEHNKYKFLQGIQFHPESYWTQHGLKLLQNFLTIKENSL
uniref:Anthranilate synthase component 2 n=1 Tax=Pterocladiophila hemisphaerica TaxID=2712948 RepID=A0A6M3WWH6_9FLOR|nr:trpG [Pterocladiophila hemisphaerica]